MHTTTGLDDRLLNPETSMQFAGHLALAGNEGTGAGLVVGEVCSAPDAGRFCGEYAFAEVSLQGLVQGHLTLLAGEIRAATSAGNETWLLDLVAWSLYYQSPVGPGGLVSLFSEKLARFAKGDDVVISFDDAGRMFFQAPVTGCTGNGAFTPHLDGRFFVFDVDLVIGNCNAAFDILNNRFAGVATLTQNNYWNYDAWLVIFLSTTEAARSSVALTMYAVALPGSDE